MSIEAEMYQLHLRPPSPASNLSKPETTELPDETEEEEPEDTDEADPSSEAAAIPIRRVVSCATTVALTGAADDNAGRLSSSHHQRRVQFADEMGQELARVKLMREPSFVPPVLPWHVIARHSADTPPDTGGDSEVPELLPDDRSSSSSSSSASRRSGRASKLKFKCQFAQPSSKYIVFRETLERRCVALSEMHFCGATAQGSVSVKNICFDKRVFVRVTFDAWRSFRDVEASHCGSADSGAQDNFTFSFPCPTLAAFEFCVCFEADNGQQVFWDNNADENYKVSVKRAVRKAAKSSGPAATSSITSSRRHECHRQLTKDFKPNFRHVTQFSKYSAWEQNGDRVYY